MFELKNPFGICDGKLITINDVPEELKGKKCNCVCPACQGHFIARLKDDKKCKHFAHDGDACDDIKAYLSGLYMLLCEYLNENNVIVLPDLYLCFSLDENYCVPEEKIHVEFESWKSHHEMFSYKSLLVASSREIHCDGARIFYDKDHIWPEAIIVSVGEIEIALVIRPPDTICKVAPDVGRYKDYSTLQVNFADSELFAKHNRTEIFNTLRSNKYLLTWQCAHKSLWQHFIPVIAGLSEIHHANKQIKLEKQELNRERDRLRNLEYRLRKEQSELEKNQLYFRKTQDLFNSEREKYEKDRIAFLYDKNELEKEKKNLATEKDKIARESARLNCLNNWFQNEQNKLIIQQAHFNDEKDKYQEEQSALMRDKNEFEKAKIGIAIEREELEKDKELFYKDKEQFTSKQTESFMSVKILGNNDINYKSEKQISRHEEIPTSNVSRNETNNQNSNDEKKNLSNNEISNEEKVATIMQTQKPLVLRGVTGAKQYWRVCQYCFKPKTQFSTIDGLCGENSPHLCVCHDCAKERNIEFNIEGV